MGQACQYSFGLAERLPAGLFQQPAQFSLMLPKL